MSGSIHFSFGYKNTSEIYVAHGIIGLQVYGSDKGSFCILKVA